MKTILRHLALSVLTGVAFSQCLMPSFYQPFEGSSTH
jgi:hypothetical protein